VIQIEEGLRGKRAGCIHLQFWVWIVNSSERIFNI
jgi:hypothetical protein